ncbi:hypothetical protein [Spongiactinospora sp. TRM90649]|uniref:hypothetical protein n=1 Tax=Spongiactinospora sp. TRM90649 TaxID=3031114 RepID=UPI0023F8A2A8|nr:hypothetical protein [Spongiactinospora sp. TRM90649]MDF5751766.1 hypothetical protein [Spongiactinospora sp. TRM90649]
MHLIRTASILAAGAALATAAFAGTAVPAFADVDADLCQAGGGRVGYDAIYGRVCYGGEFHGQEVVMTDYLPIDGIGSGVTAELCRGTGGRVTSYAFGYNRPYCRGGYFNGQLVR